MPDHRVSIPEPAKSSLMADEVGRRRFACCVLAAYALLLLAVNFGYGVLAGQDDTMFGAPYRWRQTVLVALSRMVDPPGTHYTIRGSLLDYFIAHGMAVLGNEFNGPVPDHPEYLGISKSGDRVDALIAGALRAPIDASRRSDIIRGSEIGYADYMYFAFVLFGPAVSSLYFFYFVLLTSSTLCFLVAYRRSPPLLVLLSVYLAAHLYTMMYDSRGIDLGTVHNSRTFSALALLAGIHLTVRLLSRDQRLGRTVTAAADVSQAGLVGFVVYCRLEALWTVLPAILLFACQLIRVAWTVAARRPLIPVPRAGAIASIALLVGLGAGQLWPSVWLADEYAGDTGGHPFWHVIYTGIVSANPKLWPQYLYGEEPYGDNMGYQAVLHDLRARGDATEPIAFVQDGKIYIDIMRDLANYDRLLRGITLKLIRDHPWAVIEGFYFKYRNQIDFFGNRGVYRLRPYVVPLVATYLAFLVAGLAGAPSSRPRAYSTPIFGLMVMLPFALITPSLDATITAVGTLALFVMLFVGLVAASAAVVTHLVWRAAADVIELGMPVQGFFAPNRD